MTKVSSFVARDTLGELSGFLIETHLEYLSHCFYQGESVVL